MVPSAGFFTTSVKDGEENIVFPTNKETREKIESVILDEYKKVNES